MPDGTLEFDTKIDQTGFNKGVDSLNTAAASAGNIMKGLLGADLFKAAGEQLLGFAKKGIQLASDLEEVQNVVGVTFGDGAAEINQFAKEASASFGLTELQARQFSGTIGAMVKSMGLTEAQALDMSASLVGLSGDMASFYNLDHEEAFNKIRSGIAGETEPLKQLGINMSVANLEAYALTKGIKKAYDEMSEAEKVQLRYGYIMEQTNDAQGDFVRTQDSYANQVRTLQNNLDTLGANVGSLLVPALSGAVGWLNDLFNGPVTDETTAKINDAVSALETMDQDVSNIRNQYAQDAIKIRIDYEDAQALTDEFFALKEELDMGFGDRTLRLGMQGDDVTALQEQLTALGYAIDIANEVGTFGETTKAALMQYQTDMGIAVDGIAGVETYSALAAANTQALAQKTDELIALYPQLSDYVGEDGVLALEEAEVRKLIDSYHELAITKAMQNKLSGIKEEYIEAAAALKLLEGERIVVEQNLNDALSRYNNQLTAQSKAANLVFGLDDSGLKSADAGLKIIDEWIAAYGNLDSVLASMDAYGLTYNLDKIFGADGFTLDPTLVEQDAEAMQMLLNMLTVMSQSADYTEALGEISTAEDQLAVIDEAIKEYTPQVESLSAQLEREKAAYEAALEDLESGGKDTGEAVADKAAEGIVENATALTTAIEDLAASMQATANKNKIIFPVGVAGAPNRPVAYSHATGIDRVPYDNYLARLHVGESVLTAAEAQTWREGGGQAIDYERLANAVVSAQKSAAPTPVVLEVDGRVLAETQAANNRAALNDRSRRIARGYGK